MTIWRYHNIQITPGKRWNDANGIQHPSNWHTWSDEEKAKYNITSVEPETPPDSRLYTWSMDTDGKITSTAKPLDDSGSGENKILGVKSTLKNQVKRQQGSLLSQTDWAYIRHYDAGTDVPANIETWRNAIRAKATEMENAIDAATDTAGIVALWLVNTDYKDENGDLKYKTSGILYDWPELGE